MEYGTLIYGIDMEYINGEVNTIIDGYSNSGYITALKNNDDFITVKVNILKEGYYKLGIRYSIPKEKAVHRVFINDECYGDLEFQAIDTFTIKEISSVKLKCGINKITILRQYGYLNIDFIRVVEDNIYEFKKPKFKLSNKEASKQCIDLMNFFSRIYGKRILTGQHCNKSSGTDFEYIKRMTGKNPAIFGFDLLSYSGATESEKSDFECIDELVNNRGSVDVAVQLAKKTNAIITLCWHWFSPMNGKNKSFYTKNTTFDLERALINDTEENIAMLKDLDVIAKELKKFRDNNVPVLWRPLHEACGGWFWWGAKGAEVYKKLYKLMYDRYVNYHKLNNLIWVWNSPISEWYPGDGVVDINSCDYYAPIGNHGPLTIEFLRTLDTTDEIKPLALGENGPIPDPNILRETETPWLWFMTWNNFPKELEWNKKDELIRFFNDPYVINLEDLIKLRGNI